MSGQNPLYLVFLVLCYCQVSVLGGGCGATYRSLTGVIESPNYPNDYPNNQNCIYDIIAPACHRVTLNFTHLDMEVSRLGCLYDYVEIQDGDSDNSPRIGRVCNKSVPFERRSFGNRMRVKFVTDGSVTRTGFRATFTAAKQDDSFLLIASSGAGRVASIFRMDPETKTNYALKMASTLHNPIAVDYDPAEEKVYWTEVRRDFNVIRSASLNGSGSVRTVHDAGQNATLDGLAVDALSRLLFYVDAGNDEIAVLSMSSWLKKTVVSSNLDRPRDIVLDIYNGVMFWTDWGRSRIERANYDGSDRRTLVSFNLLLPNALALDFANKRLYFADAGTNLVESVTLEGSDRQPLLRAVSSRHFFGLALLQNALYITDWGPDGAASTESLLVRQPLDVKNENLTVVGSIGKRMNGIHAYQQNALMAGPNGCSDNNGGCGVFCVPLSNTDNKCMCPNGKRLASNQKTCL